MDKQLLDEGGHLSEFSSGKINPTELIALLIIKGKDFVDGIEYVYKHIKGSCSMLLLTENGIIAARDSWGRTPIVVGSKEGAMAVTSETTAFPNLGFETTYYVGPGEIVRIDAEQMEVLRPANPRKQVCSFLWVYYGYPSSSYEGVSVEQARYNCGKNMAKRHRRTKAEMAIARAEKAEKIAKKFQAKIDKKLDEHPQVIGMRPVDFQVSDPNDPNKYEFSEFVGSEQECLKFMEKHPEHDYIGKVPYLYEGSKYRITYWKKV